MKIYVICSVRNGTPPEISKLVEAWKEDGHSVHFPPDDAPQDDPTGYQICSVHRDALIHCDRVYVFWDVKSFGSHFDLGMAFALKKKITLLKSYHPDTPEKSYEKVMKIWQTES